MVGEATVVNTAAVGIGRNSRWSTLRKADWTASPMTEDSSFVANLMNQVKDERLRDLWLLAVSK